MRVPSVVWLPAGLDACALYRMFFAHLKMKESMFLFQPMGTSLDELKNRNVAVVQRLSTKQNYEAMKLFKSLGMKVVYDLDDDLWAVPTFNPAYKIMKKWIPGFEVCARLADVVTVSTEHLKLMVRKALGKACPRIEVVENAADFDWFRKVDKEYRKKRNGRVVLGWAGTDTHSGDVQKVFSLIPTLLRKHEKLQFETVGEVLTDELRSFGDRVKQRNFLPIAEFAVNWASWQWDISLAPVVENAFNLSKSNIKMIEAASIEIPCVATRYGEYAKFASSSELLKKTVMATGSMEWKERLSTLIDDKELRTKVGKEMYRVAVTRYNIEDRVRRWRGIFSEMLA